MQIISRKFNDIEVVFENSNSLYINATEIAKHFNKQPSDWLRLKDTKAYIEAFIRSGNSPSEKLVIVKKSGNYKEQGTWIHKKLIIAFARWLDPEFAVWCDGVIEEILKTGSYSIAKTEKPDLEKLEERARVLEISEQEFNVFERVFYKLGIDRKEELAITTNRAVKKETGVDFLEIAEKKGLSTPEKYFTVTELCQIVMNGDFSKDVKKLVSTKKGDKPRPQNLNKLLEKLGFQFREDDLWKATEKGKKFSDFVQNKSKYSEKTVFHTVWKKEILNNIF
ncbi:KilA-N domain-containing protein [Thiovulum sp. ES]|nr:KilA-N domain-containing protein [Thiovulum sp. ES]